MVKVWRWRVLMLALAWAVAMPRETRAQPAPAPPFELLEHGVRCVKGGDPPLCVVGIILRANHRGQVTIVVSDGEGPKAELHRADYYTEFAGRTQLIPVPEVRSVEVVFSETATKRELARDAVACSGRESGAATDRTTAVLAFLVGAAVCMAAIGLFQLARSNSTAKARPALSWENTRVSRPAEGLATENAALKADIKALDQKLQALHAEKARADEETAQCHERLAALESVGAAVKEEADAIRAWLPLVVREAVRGELRVEVSRLRIGQAAAKSIAAELRALKGPEAGPSRAADTPRKAPKPPPPKLAPELDSFLSGMDGWFIAPPASDYLERLLLLFREAGARLPGFEVLLLHLAQEGDGFDSHAVEVRTEDEKRSARCTKCGVTIPHQLFVAARQGEETSMIVVAPTGLYAKYNYPSGYDLLLEDPPASAFSIGTISSPALLRPRPDAPGHYLVEHKLQWTPTRR